MFQDQLKKKTELCLQGGAITKNFNEDAQALHEILVSHQEKIIIQMQENFTSTEGVDDFKNFLSKLPKLPMKQNAANSGAPGA